MDIYNKDSHFMKEVERVKENGFMNMYVGEAIDKRVPEKELVREIKRAYKKHVGYAKEFGSSVMHVGVAAAMLNLLSALERDKRQQ